MFSIAASSALGKSVNEKSAGYMPLLLQQNLLLVIPNFPFLCYHTLMPAQVHLWKP